MLFEKGRVHVNGVFLAKAASAARFGFEREEVLKVDPAEVDLPCFFDVSIPGGVSFCRGEITWRLSDEPAVLLKRWDIRLSFGFPPSLKHAFDLNAQGEVVGPGSASRTDVRYSRERDVILRHVGVSLETPYLEEVAAERGRERVETYRRAVETAKRRKS